MQVKKERIRKNILNSAKREFNKNMFQNASMRKIAEDAGITTSNIYNYFENKDDVFKELLKPTIQNIENGFNFASSLISKDSSNNHNIFWYKDQIAKIMKFIDNNREDLELLLLKSQGSFYENFRDIIVLKYTDIYDKQYKSLKKQYPDFRYNISRTLWQNLIMFIVNFVYEIIKNKISLIEMKKLNDELLNIIFNGFTEYFNFKS